MARVQLKFFGTDESETQEHELFIYANQRNEIYISIDSDTNSEYHLGYICLDKETAIKFSRELRKQISFLEREV